MQGCENTARAFWVEERRKAQTRGHAEEGCCTASQKRQGTLTAWQVVEPRVQSEEGIGASGQK